MSGRSIAAMADHLIRTYLDSLTDRVDLLRIHLVRDAKLVVLVAVGLLGAGLLGLIGWIALMIWLVKILQLISTPLVATFAVVVVNFLGAALCLNLSKNDKKEDDAEAARITDESIAESLLWREENRIKISKEEFKEELANFKVKLRRSVDVKKAYRKNPTPFIASALVLGFFVGPRVRA